MKAYYDPTYENTEGPFKGVQMLGNHSIMEKSRSPVFQSPRREIRIHTVRYPQPFRDQDDPEIKRDPRRSTSINRQTPATLGLKEQQGEVREP